MNSHKVKVNYKLIVLIAFWAVTLCLLPTASVYADSSYNLFNPYEDVDWRADGQFRANLHTHTTNSNGTKNTLEMCALYDDLGYSILGFADHNWVTYADGYNGDMLVLPFNEVGHKLPTEKHHMLSMFTDFYDTVGHGIGDAFALNPSGDYNDDYGQSYGDEMAILEAATKYDDGKGRFVLCHPGAYTDLSKIYGESGYNLDWYINLFNTYPTVLGIEIYNDRDSHSYVRDLWDIMLTETMPSRNIYAFANDDNHGFTTGISFETFIMKSVSEENLKNSMDKGHFFVSSFGANNFDSLMRMANIKTYNEFDWIPIIYSIDCERKQSTITLDCGQYDKIEWISAYGEVIGEGNSINYKQAGASKYVRAVLTKTVTVPNNAAVGVADRYITYDVCKTYTQPFAIGGKSSVGCGGSILSCYYCLLLISPFTLVLLKGKNKNEK